MDSSCYVDVEMDDSLTMIRGELASLSANLSRLNLQRKQALNDYLDLKGSIRVFCRVRPFNPDDRCSRSRPIITTDSSSVFLQIAEHKSKKYGFNKVFHPLSTQEQVFSEIEPVIKSALDGYNVCIFAYGQTGTGKTYTMEGRSDCRGLVLRAIEAMLEQASENNYKFLITFSMLEIYMGCLRDLLLPQTTKAKVQKAPRLSIQTDPNGGIEIENLMAIKVSDYEQVTRLYKLGNRFRSTASTMSNSTSSRSHSLIRISLTCLDAPERRRETNKIWMVDLGGSERLLKTQATGRRLEEGKAINLSLSALGDVISALQSKKHHVPYRNSKLTQVLRDSLGTDSKTLMLVHVSPRKEDTCETVCSLGFATRVGNIHLGSEEPIEMRAKKEVVMVDLLEKVKHLESECQDVKRNIERLDKKLKHLERPEILSEGHLEASILYTEEQQSNMGNNVKIIREPTRASTTIPRFMRPTVCSQRKTTVDHTTLRNIRKKPPALSKTRKSVSVYAESVTSPATDGVWQSDYCSECSISMISDLNWKYYADDATECCQSAAEYKIKKVILPEQERSPRTSMTTDRSVDEMVIDQVDKIGQNKQLNIDNWINLRTAEQSSTYWSKRVIAIPVDNADKSGKQNHESKIYKSEQQQYASAKNPGTAIKEDGNAFIKKQQNFYKLLSEAVMIEKSPENSTTKENRTFAIDQPSEITDAQGHQGHNSDRKVKPIPEYQEEEPVKSPKQFAVGSGSIMLIETPVSHDKTIPKNRRCEDICAHSQHKTNAEEICLRSIRSRRSLFMEKDLPMLDQKNGAVDESIVPANNFQEEKHILEASQLLLDYVQMLWAVLLLALGVRIFGSEDDFFHGLMS